MTHSMSSCLSSTSFASSCTSVPDVFLRGRQGGGGRPPRCIQPQMRRLRIETGGGFRLPIAKHSTAVVRRAAGRNAPEDIQAGPAGRGELASGAVDSLAVDIERPRGRLSPRGAVAVGRNSKPPKRTTTTSAVIGFGPAKMRRAGHWRIRRSSRLRASGHRPPGHRTH